MNIGPARTRLRQVPGRPGYTYVQLPAGEVAQLHRRFVNPRTYHALLGDGIGTLEVPGQPDYVFIRIGNDRKAGIVFNQRVMPRNDAPVNVGYLPEQPGVLQVLSLRIPPHHSTHEWLDDVLYVTCAYCGRIWPSGQHKCWDGVVGCGASLELHCASL